jgi:hypothetical protein
VSGPACASKFSLRSAQHFLQPRLVGADRGVARRRSNCAQQVASGASPRLERRRQR